MHGGEKEEEKGIFCRTESVAMTPKSRDHNYAYYVTLGSRCKMANSSSQDKTDTLSERPTRIQPYQFEPVRQDFEEYRNIVSASKQTPLRYSMGFAKSHSLKCSLQKWA